MRAQLRTAIAGWLTAVGTLGAQSVPVTKVMLFSSGVGYFEHAGSVRGNASTELRFKTSQINDILKSLVLQDQDGGRVGAITYPSLDPIDKTLKSFQVDITRNPSLADLLNQLRGARVTLAVQAEHLTGTILGVERRQKTPERGEEPVEVPVLNLLTGASIRSIELPSIASLTLDDPQLQDELTKALTALVQARDQDKKPVTINFAGTGDRHVRIGYVVETPVWKTSYRLLLGDKSSAFLQGWAMVDNQTESDWNNVSLSLVSGRPVSFTMDLYRPLYATRPVVRPVLWAGLTPQRYDAAMSTADSIAFAPAAAPAPANAAKSALGSTIYQGAGQGGRRIGYDANGRPMAMALSEVVVTGKDEERDLDAMASVQALGTSGAMGELFQYAVGHVTLARHKSAMLPIVNDSVQVERLSIYNEGVLGSHPLNGVRMKNNSGKHLLQGPLTVMDGGYAGDARIDDVPPGQDRLLSYGVDLETLASTKWLSTDARVTTARIIKGMLWVDTHVESTKSYALENKSDKDKAIIIEHPVRSGWTLVDTPKPLETTPAAYRFKGDAPPHKVATLTVKEESVRSESLAMLPMDVSALLIYQRNGSIPAKVRDAIAKAITLKNAVTDLDRQIAARTQDINGITAEQGRIRENMKTVSNTTPYYQRLLTKLNEQESQLESLHTDRDALTTKRDAARKDLEDYLSNLTIV
jgi:hypothetical protein